MRIRNCEVCGKIFKPIVNKKVCPYCRKLDDEKFSLVKEYLYDHPGASIEEVVEQVNVSRRKILFYLREGRLETVGSHMVIECEKCGKPITSGQYCDKCLHKMTSNFKIAARTLHKPRKIDKGIGMHTKK